MGYACPVCGDPQADGEHLANHLAFTAMLGDGDHESWLAEYAPDWESADADSLAATVTDHAEPVEFPQVFEDTTESDHDHDRDDREARSGALFEDGADGIDADAARDRARRDRELDAQAEQILEDAREMTREMHDETDTTDDEGESRSVETDPDESETE